MTWCMFFVVILAESILWIVNKLTIGDSFNSRSFINPHDFFPFDDLYIMTAFFSKKTEISIFFIKKSIMTDIHEKLIRF